MFDAPEVLLERIRLGEDNSIELKAMFYWIGASACLEDVQSTSSPTSRS